MIIFYNNTYLCLFQCVVKSQLCKFKKRYETIKTLDYIEHNLAINIYNVRNNLYAKISMVNVNSKLS